MVSPSRTQLAGEQELDVVAMETLWQSAVVLVHVMYDVM